MKNKNLDVVEQPLVSVIILSYNGRKYLADCIHSLLDQEFSHEFDIWLFDNGSQDNSADFVEQTFPQVSVIRFEENLGPDKAFNLAVTYVNGRYIAYINQDAVAHRRWLIELVNTIQQNPMTAVVQSNMILPQWPEYDTKTRSGSIARAYVCDTSAYGTHEFRIESVTPNSPPFKMLAVYGAGCIFDPKLVDQLGYWLDPDYFAYADDFDLGLRLNASGFKVLLAHQSVVYHDTEWHFEWNMRSLRRAVWATRNIVLSLYKICYPSEFVRLLPQFLLGKLIKAGQASDSMWGRIAYAIAGLPLVVYSFLAAVVLMPKFYRRRQVTMNHRKMPHGWVVEQFRNINWEPSTDIWKTSHQSQTSAS